VDHEKKERTVSLFDLPTSAWTLRELEVGAVEAARQRDEARCRGDQDVADVLHGLASLLALRRDERRALACQVDDAANPFVVLSVGLYPDGPADR
jgi:hypothetical protein